MIYKKQTIHMPSLSSLFLAGIVIGNSCNTINRSNSDDEANPLGESLEQQNSGLTSTSDVDRDKVALQDMPPSLEDFLGHRLSHLKDAPLVLEEADFYNKSWEDSFKTRLESLGYDNGNFDSGCSNGTQLYFKSLFKKLFYLIKIKNGVCYIDGFQIQDHEFELLTRGLNSVPQYYQYLYKIGKKLWEAVVNPLELKERIEKLEELDHEWKILLEKKKTFLDDTCEAYCLIKDLTGNKFGRQQVYHEMAGDTRRLFNMLDDYLDYYKKVLNPSKEAIHK